MRIFLLGVALAAIGTTALAVPENNTTPVVTAQPGSPPPAPLPQPVTAELNDGSKVEFEADGAVLVVGADGTKTPAPDGVLSLKDGVPFVVKDGKRVSSE